MAGKQNRRAAKSLLIIGLIVLLTSIFSTLIFITRPRVKPAEKQRSTQVPVRVKELEREPFCRSITLLGTAKALKRAKVAAEVPGNIVWISERCEPGEKVSQGEVLVRLDGEPYRIAVEQAEAALAEARAAYELQQIDNELQAEQLSEAESELEVAESELARKRELSERSAISSSAYDREASAYARIRSQYLARRSRVQSSQALLARARSALDLARANRDRAALDLARTELKAPFAGVVAARYVELGNRLAVNTAAFEVVDYGIAVVEVEVPSRHLELMRGGVEVHVSAQGGKLLRSGEFRYLAPKADPRTRLFAAKVYVSNDEGETPLLPGQFVTVKITEKRPVSALVVPFAAITQDSQGDYVFLVDRQSGRKARKVYIEQEWQQEDVALVSGLSEGVELVVEGQENLVEGAAVAVLPSEKSG
ncbi:MAG: efflux RND transporter periplasmic adaptor subunit [Syntrophobacteria bacterium]